MATKDDLKVLGATFAAALADFRVEVTNSAADFRVEVANAFAEAAKERAAMIKSQARHLYMTGSTIALATISIRMALLAGPAGG